MPSDLPLITPQDTIREAMAVIDKWAKGIALVVDQERRLIGTVTDGDVRRAVLAGVSLDMPISELLADKANSPYPRPVTAPPGVDRGALLHLMQERSVRQIPLVDNDGRVVDLATLDDLLPEQVLPLQVMIMAGGFGTRLLPLTEDLPKPMLPVGKRPLMELTLERLRQAGIRRVNVAVHYKAEKITDYFGDGRDFGIELNYVAEDCPLGTAGALGLMQVPQEPLLVINGDILTQVDFRAMLAYHRKHKADLTVAVRQYDLQIPYGVIECEGAHVRQVREKPHLRFLVNAGIYLLEPSVHSYISPNGTRLDMTDLIQRLLEDGRSVVSFPIVEYWLDIGRPADYEQAQVDMRNGRLTP
jgi:dTDP-glucose pyrophosphorylase/CBS domain-containing protein